MSLKPHTLGGFVQQWSLLLFHCTDQHPHCTARACKGKLPGWRALPACLPWGEPCESPPGLADPQLLPHGAQQTRLPSLPQHAFSPGAAPYGQKLISQGESPCLVPISLCPCCDSC